MAEAEETPHQPSQWLQEYCKREQVCDGSRVIHKIDGRLGFLTNRLLPIVSLRVHVAPLAHCLGPGLGHTKLGVQLLVCLLEQTAVNVVSKQAGKRSVD